MGNCYSADHIAEHHIYTDITCSIEGAQQKFRLGKVSNRLLGRGGFQLVLLDPNLAQSICLGLKSYTGLRR